MRAPVVLLLLLVVLAFVALVPRAARAESAPSGQPGDEFTISVLTMGPGDHPFFKFGHNALLVHDAALRRDEVYNFGTFQFQSATLISDFMKGRLRYWLSVQSFGSTVAHYRNENRSLDAQELALSAAQKRRLVDRLRRNAEPDQRYYKYDYYLDNCSTRVRDAIDAVIDGRLRAASQSPAEMSFRAHTERVTGDDFWFALALDIALGPEVDRPISQWEEMFLPSKLEESLRRVTLTTPDGDVPLVAQETVLVAANRPPLPRAPPVWTAWFAIAGVVLGGLFAGLGRVGAQRRIGRVAFGVLAALVSLVLGLLGCAFLVLWTATDHGVAYRNANLLQCSPIALALAVVAVALACTRRGGERGFQALAGGLLASSGLGLLLAVLRVTHQDNARFIALFLPIWLGVWLGARGEVWFGSAPCESPESGAKRSLAPGDPPR
jgi:hypothetical protein